MMMIYLQREEKRREESRAKNKIMNNYDKESRDDIFILFTS